jgi:cell division protein FtsN
VTAKRTSKTQKKKAPPRKEPEARKIPASMWILNLALAALFLGFLYHLRNVPQTTIAATDKPAPAAASVAKAPALPAAEKKIDKAPFHYDYEKLLPEAKVIPPNVKEYEPKEDTATYEYRLQTGSFRRREDAEKQKAAIAFQGMRAEIKELKKSEADIWYRVEVGPITSRSRMNKAVDRLVRINIQPLVLKQKLADH